MMDMASAATGAGREAAETSLPVMGSAPPTAFAEADAWPAPTLLRSPLDAMPNGVCLFDAHQRAILFNQQHLAMFDFAPDAVRPGMTFREMLQHLGDSGQLPEASIERLWQQRSALIAEGRPFSVRRQRP